jgi:hypothetical protein
MSRNPAEIDPGRVYNLAQVAEFLPSPQRAREHLTAQSVRNLIHDGHLPAIHQRSGRLGQPTYFFVLGRDLLGYLHQHQPHLLPGPGQPSPDEHRPINHAQARQMLTRLGLLEASG